MAIELFPDSPSSGISPRISFSHDLPQSDVVPVEQYIRSTSPSSSIDFDFCVFRESFNQEPSSADELFFDGKILPIEIKKRLSPFPSPAPPPIHTPPPPSSASLPPPSPHQKVPAKTINPCSESAEEKQKSFWRFKRSSSLNCGSGSSYGRTLCPLPLLSRSNSTGSTASGKRSSISSSQKQSNFVKCNSSNTSQKQSTGYTSSSRPPLKKSGHFSHGGGIKFNPVLNVSPAALFGLGSIFSGGKDRSKKKY